MLYLCIITEYCRLWCENECERTGLKLTKNRIIYKQGDNHDYDNLFTYLYAYMFLQIEVPLIVVLQIKVQLKKK